MGYIIRKPMAVQGRRYPNGDYIPDSLPSKYRPSERCDNCAAYVPMVPIASYCKTFDAVVRPEYVCAVWKPIKA